MQNLYSLHADISLTSFLFNNYLKANESLLYNPDWSIKERLFLWLLDSKGYFVSNKKIPPAFLAKLYNSKIDYFAFKAMGSELYYIVLKSYSKKNKNLVFLKNKIKK